MTQKTDTHSFSPDGIRRRMKIKVMMRKCQRCESWHAHWWDKSTVRPPSCKPDGS